VFKKLAPARAVELTSKLGSIRVPEGARGAANEA
jgi:hypothetical protein